MYRYTVIIYTIDLVIQLLSQSSIPLISDIKLSVVHPIWIILASLIGAVYFMGFFALLKALFTHLRGNSSAISEDIISGMPLAFTYSFFAANCIFSINYEMIDIW
jgi:cation transport ATPase